MLRFPHRVSSLAGSNHAREYFWSRQAGLMSALMEICCLRCANLSDSQAVIHNELALGLLLCSANLDAMSEAIEARCEQTGSALRMQRVNADDYGSWSQTLFRALNFDLINQRLGGAAAAGSKALPVPTK